MNTLSTEKIIEQIQEVLDLLRPNFYLHGGDIELVKFVPETGEVHVRLQGNCIGCPASTYTLKLMVEESLKQEVPQVQRVIDVDADLYLSR